MLGYQKTSGSEQLCTQDCYGLSTQAYAISNDSNANYSSAGGCLISEEFVFVEELTPERAEAAMGSASYRVFVDAYPRCKITRDKIVAWRGGTTGDDYPLHR